MKLSQAHLDLIRNYFVGRPVLRAYLFGSYAKDAATPASDVDILLELEADHSLGLEFIQMKLDLEKLLEKEVDLVTIKGLSSRIRPRVEKTKQLIYAR